MQGKPIGASTQKSASLLKVKVDWQPDSHIPLSTTQAGLPVPGTHSTVSVGMLHCGSVPGLQFGHDGGVFEGSTKISPDVHGFGSVQPELEEELGQQQDHKFGSTRQLILPEELPELEQQSKGIVGTGHVTRGSKFK